MEFLDRQIQSFLDAHSYGDGWKVHYYSQHLAGNLYLECLMDFLRDCHPESLRRKEVIGKMRSYELLGISDRRHKIVPESEWDLLRELDQSRWIGTVHIEWNRHPIHFLRIPIGVMQGGLLEYLNCVAIKSNAALRTFHHELEQYGKKRWGDVTREILVVNGEDIPIKPFPWENIVLPKGFVEEIRDNVQAFFQARERYQRLGIPWRRGFLFVGPPGCGKTCMIKALAANMPNTFITIIGRTNVDDGDLERTVSLAERHKPAVIIFEDLDRLVGTKDVSLSCFLNLLDGLKITDGVLVIATCNDATKLDQALLHRPSRFDRIWKFPLPGYEQRLVLLQKHGGGYFSEEVLEEAARRSEGFSMAYVQEIVVSALLECAHDDLAPGDDCLFKSLNTLRVQRKSASKPGESMDERESVGFCASGNGKC
jgi:hypothetical protein